MIPFAIRLKEAMRDKDMKQVELCRKTGITKGVICGYLHGRYYPKRHNFEKLSEALEVSVDWLMGYETAEKCLLVRPHYLEKLNTFCLSLIEDDRKKAYQLLLIAFDRKKEFNEEFFSI